MTKRSIGLLYTLLSLLGLGMLAVGLYPFNFLQENRAFIDRTNHWIQFRRPSFALVSPVPEKLSNIGKKPFTIRIEVSSLTRPSRYLSYILSAYDAGREILVIGQWKSGVVYRLFDSQRRREELGYPSAFRSPGPVVLTLCAGADETVLYVNEKAVRRWPRAVHLDGMRFAQGIVLGNSADGTHPWKGRIETVTFYDRVLAPQERFEQLRVSDSKGSISPPGSAGQILRLSFDREPFISIPETAGRPSGGAWAGSTHLRLPDRFRPPVLRAFTPPWVDFSLRKTYFADLAVNLIGFMPVGLTLGILFFYKKLSAFKAAVASGLLSGALSFTIELLQVFLPGRTSQLSDLLLNIAGGIIGAGVMRALLKTRKQMSSG